jgi:hypothetical protein
MGSDSNFALSFLVSLVSSRGPCMEYMQKHSLSELVNNKGLFVGTK